ncbi:MAG: hypothetical protein HON70_25200, partial [Lentisphaerae bacterium]|nr:hypothetical protein [Lentisphaerota bacterium]
WNSWNKIEPWPERRPAIGWYDEGAPEVADWHIKYALEHGINGFIYCWYRRGLGAEIEQSSGHAIHEGLYNARYRDMFTFTIMWTSGSTPVEDEADLLENLMPFWLENYFTHPSYLKIDNHPIFFVYRARALIAQLGGPEKARHALNRMRAQCRVAGFKGMRILACMSAASQKLGPEIVASGWDGVTGYCLRPKGIATAGVDPAGLAYYDYADVLSRYKQTWIDRDACTGDVPDIPNVVMGWDTRAWASAVKRGRGWYIATPQVQTFEAACRDAKELVDAKAAERWDSRMVVFDNWTEFGEGHYIEPTTGTGFSFVNAIKRVFCSDWAPESVTDIIPEDLGMLPPQRRYEDARAGYGNRMPWQPVRLVGDLLVCWEFEREKDGYFLDSSLNDCRLRPEGGTVVSGRGGKILCCNNGGATFPATVPFFGDSGVVSPAVAPFFHPGGVSIALWCKPAEANQSNRWMLSAAGTPARYRRQELGGYRLGLSGGCPVWQVPREKWDDGLRAPDPLPVDEWSHVAATFDSRTMRLYVNGKEVASLARRGHVKRGRPLITVGAQNAGPDRMGGYTPGPGTQFRGWLDSIRVWRRVLPTDEIAVFAGE